MMASLHFLVSDTQDKLGRTLKEEEITFLKWMAWKQEQEQFKKELQHK